MRGPHARRPIELLAALSMTTNFLSAATATDEASCHRSLFRELLESEGEII
jgi:hypothetical protein